jgi:drug/metabolite transporter (DMT)-like permease
MAAPENTPTQSLARGDSGSAAQAGPAIGPPLARVYLLLVLATLLWGGGPVAGKLGLGAIPPITMGLLRFGLAAAALLALHWRRLPAWRSLSRHDLWMLLGLGIFGAFLNHVLFFAGLLFAPASHGALIAPTTVPIWTVLLAAWVGGERVTRAQALGLLVCLAGVALVVQPGAGETGSTWPVLQGDLLLALSSAAWSIYSVLSKMAMRRLSSEATLTYGMCVGCLFLAATAMIERPWVVVPRAPLLAWGTVLYLTVAMTLLAFFWWNLALQRLGAGRTAVFTNLVPIFGVGLAWLILGERLSRLQLAGGALALAGVWLCQGTGGLQAAWRRAMAPRRGAGSSGLRSGPR